MPLGVMSAVNRLVLRGALSRELALMRTMQHAGESSAVPEAAELLGPATTTLQTWCEGRAAERAGRPHARRAA